MFFTQRGLKIRLEKQYCFIQSLKSRINFEDAQTFTEVFASLRDFYAFLCGISLFLSRADYKLIFKGTFFITAIGIIIPLFYLSMKFYLMLSLNSLFFECIFSIVPSFIDKIILAIIGFIFVGLKATLIYFSSFYICIFLSWCINFLWTKHIYKKTGIVITDIERIFINVLRVYTKPKIAFNKWIDDYKAHISQPEENQQIK